MKLALYTDDLLDVDASLVSVGVFSDEPDRGLTFADLNRRLDGMLEQACRDEDFSGRPGQSVIVNLPPGRELRRVAVFGLGERKAFDGEGARSYAGAAARWAGRVGASSMALGFVHAEEAEGSTLGLFQALAEGLHLGRYRYDELRTREVKASPLEAVHVAFSADDVHGLRGSDLRDALDRGGLIARGVMTARDLINAPANVLTPVELAERAKRMAKAHELSCKILTPRDMERQNMHLHLGVGQGSRNEPRLIHLAYEPAGKKNRPVLVLVGKGLTFDAGGLSIKTSEGMMEMKIDMGGAAAVMGAMHAIAALKPDVVVHGVIGAAENMPDGNAIRPGDVIKGKRGISVEILNTDAEGRLVLADTLAYAQDLGPDYLVDLATLTGACMVALGRQRSAAYYREGPMQALFEKAWAKSGELFWRLPLARELKDQLKSDVADIKNIGDRWGGSITAALFLEEFIDSELPWAHLDIAGPVFAAAENGHIPKGGTGFGVRTLVAMCDQLQTQS
ncbi:MAG: leucyl aminopeptidase [Myxococcota bacterium]